MYNEFYNFREKPFSLTPDPEYLYQSTAHKRAYAYLEYGIQDPSGFVCITGEIGAGKTTLIRVFLNQLSDQIKVARLFNTKVSSRQFLEMILQDLGLESQGKTKAEMIDRLNRYLIDTFAEGKRVVLIIDEAQNLSTDLLEEIRLISNLETEKTKLLQIFLVGQAELRDSLLLPNLEQFRQRITVNYHIPPLDKNETKAYILHRIKVASLGPMIEIPEAVMGIIYEYSGGVPRLINVICDALLLYGFVAERKEPDIEMIKEVVDDMIQEGTLRDPALKDSLNGTAKKIDGNIGDVLNVLTGRIKILEQRQSLFEKTFEGLIEMNRSLAVEGTELLQRLEKVHQREQVLAVQGEKLKTRETLLAKREQSVQEMLVRIKNEK